MKIKNLALALSMAIVASQAFAINDPKYDKNVAMTCGKFVVLTSENTTSLNYRYGGGQLVNERKHLGEVYIQAGNARQSLPQVGKAKRSIIGIKQGFGLFENDRFRLDLTDTVGNWDIYLKDKKTGEEILCVVQGDCC